MADSIELAERSLRNELNHSDLFPFETELVENLSERLKKNVQLIEEARKGISEVTAESHTVSFLISIYKMEVSRISFLLQSYLRIRHAKIERFYFYYQQIEPSKYEQVLSECEKEYLQKYYQLMNEHLIEEGKLESFIIGGNKNQKLLDYPPAPSQQCYGGYFVKDNPQLAVNQNIVFVKSLLFDPITQIFNNYNQNTTTSIYQQIQQKQKYLI